MDKEARKFLNPQGEKLVEILQASDEEIEIAELKAQVHQLSDCLRYNAEQVYGQVLRLTNHCTVEELDTVMSHVMRWRAVLAKL